MSRAYIDRIELGSTVGFVRETIVGTGTPTVETVGFPGQRYYDEVGKVEYRCTAAVLAGDDDVEYHWEKVSAGGLTDADKAEIAALVLDLLPTWEGGSY